jgi:hypothetical protein
MMNCNPLENSNVIITLRSEKGVMNSAGTCIYIRDDNGDLRKVGFIQRLRIEADANDFHIKVIISFPPRDIIEKTSSSSLIKENIKLLSDAGCVIEYLEA